MSDREPRPQDQPVGKLWERPGGYVLRPSRITPEEAIAMVDEVLRSHGIEPSLTLLPSGWRRFAVGPQVVYSGVVPSEDGVPYLQVVAPIVQLPEEADLGELLRQMLILNHFQTRSVRFSLDEGMVVIGVVRPILGLDPDEVDDAIGSVITHAGAAQAWLSRALPDKARRKPLPPESLPRVRLRPKEMKAVNDFLAACAEKPRRVACRLMERWDKAGYAIGVGAGSIQLKAPLGRTHHTMIAITQSLTAASPRLIIGWEGLRRTGAFTDEAVAAYQKTIAALTPVETTESAAHILIGDDMSEAFAGQIVTAMDKLVREAGQPLLRARGEVTVENVEATLADCPTAVREIFAFLIGGWRVAGGAVRATRPGRISLKIEGVRPDGAAGTSEIALATLGAPRKNKPAAIDLGWGLAKGDYAYLAHVPEAVQEYERVGSSLPGFQTRGTITKIVVEGGFSAGHATQLLEVMLALKSASEAKR